MLKMVMNCRDRLDRVPTMMKTRQDDNVTNCTNMVDTKNEMSCCDRSNHVQSMTKTKQDNDMTDRIGLAYAKTRLFGPF